MSVGEAIWRQQDLLQDALGFAKLDKIHQGFLFTWRSQLNEEQFSSATEGNGTVLSHEGVGHDFVLNGLAGVPL